MRNFALVGAALWLLATPALAIYKCTDAAGKVTYSGTPCPTTQKEQSMDPGSSTANTVRGSGPTPSSASATARRVAPQIDFGATPEAQLLKSTALLESMAVDGRDCEWALKVEKAPSKCIGFLSQMTDGNEWTQVNAAVKGFLTEDFYATHRSELEKVKRLMSEVAGYSQFAQVRILGK